MKAHIDSRDIDRTKNSTYIVLEAGPTHTGLESAKALAKVAKEAGADAVKFQLLYADRIVADKSIPFTYSYLSYENGEEVYTPKTEPLYDILKRRELSKEAWRELKNYCDAIGITMFSTATYKDEVDFLVDELKVGSIKVNSSDVNDLEFIRYCASKGVNIQLDTGNADIWEIERAVIEAEEAGCDNIIIHLCPTGYPAHLESIHLNMITTLKAMFPMHSIAFSDHSPYWKMDIAAVALGAEMVEKTITLDRTTMSCEHSFSIEPSMARSFVNDIREIETALGSARRTFPKAEKEKRKATRRSPYALKELPIGTVIQKDDFEFRRPGFGIVSEDFDNFIGKKLVKPVAAGEMISYAHV